MKSLFNYKWKKGAGKEWDKEKNRAVAVELVNNESLRRFIKRSPLSPPQVDSRGPVASCGERERGGGRGRRRDKRKERQKAKQS